MIYLLLSGACTLLGITGGVGASTLLRPLLDAVSSISGENLSILCTAAALGAALISAFFALNQPIALHQDELILLAIGAALGGILGDLISARFFAQLPERGTLLLQNGLLLPLLALPSIYASALSRTSSRLSITRMASLPAALLLGIIASFLSFGAVPLTLAVYDLLFDAREEEASIAALTVSLCAMAGKMLTLLIRLRLNLPNADVLLWLLPGAVLGAVCAMIPGLQRSMRVSGNTVLNLSVFCCLINMAAALA